MAKNLLERSDTLDKRIDNASGIGQAIDSLTKYGQRSRRITYWLGLSVFLDIALSVGLIFVFTRTVHNSTALAEARAVAVATCNAVNEAGSTNKQLWDYILNLPPDSTRNLTDAQKAEQDKRTSEFKVFMNKAFAQRECK